MKKLVMFLMFISFLILLSFSVSAAVLNVPGDNATIQGAIDNASNGDTINVSGSYNEDLIINKSLEIKSEDGATIKGVANVNTGDWPLAAPNIEILADNVKIHGFTIESPDYVSGKYTSGIVIGAKNTEIYDNDFIINSAETIDEVSQVIQTYSKTAMPGVDISGLNIHDNTFTHKHNAGTWGYEGIYINPDEETSTVYIQNNDFSGKILRAITSERSRTTIFNNKIITDLAPGDLSFAGAYQGINVRKFDSSSQININIERNTIKGSDSSKGFYQGIRLGQTGQSFSNADIRYNTLNYNSFGILTKIASGVLINYNGIEDNVFGLQNDDVSLLNLSAENNWWGDCSGPGPVASGSGNGVSANVTYTPWLGACIKNKTREPNCVLKTNNVTLRANVSSLVCVDNVRFGININGIWNNYSYTSQQGDIYSFILTSNLLTGNTSVFWTVYADDCYNHTQQDGLESFYVNRRTNLSVAPSNPDGKNSWYVSEPLFTLTNNDAGDKWYMWDSTGAILYTTPFGLDDIPNSPPKESAGILELNWWSDVCANESGQSRIFKVDLTSPRFLDLTPIGNVYNNLKPMISAYIDEIYQSNSGVNKSSVVMKVDDVVVNAGVNDADTLDVTVSYIPGSNLLSGLHNVSLYAEDKAGRSNETFWEFYINITGIFNFSVYSPISLLYGEKRINFNLSATEDLVEISYIDWNDNRPRWKKLCSDCKEYGNKKKKTRTFNDGKHNITIKAKDYFEQEKEVNVEFEVDSKEPKIIRTLPNKNKVTNGSGFYVKYSEDNLKQVSVSWNPTQTLVGCEAGINKECYVDLNLTAYNNQYINYWFSVSDFVREINSSIIRVFVDTTSPVLSVNSPNSIDYSRYVLFNISVSEDVKLEYIDNSDAHPRWRRLCTNCDEYEKNKAFSRGNHNLLIRAEDKAGNSDVELVSFFVDY